MSWHRGYDYWTGVWYKKGEAPGSVCIHVCTVCGSCCFRGTEMAAPLASSGLERCEAVLRGYGKPIGGGG